MHIVNEYVYILCSPHVTWVTQITYLDTSPHRLGRSPVGGVGGAGELGKKSDLCHGRAAATTKRGFTKLHQMTR